MRFADIKAFRKTIENTPYSDLKTWDEICQENRISTEGVLFWFWLTWSYQLEEIGRINFLFIEWRFRNVKLTWPYGTHRIPVGILGQARPNWNTLNLNYKNATT